MALALSVFMTVVPRHFLLVLPSVIVLFHVTPSFGETIKSTLFDKSHLCSNTFAGTKSVHARSKVGCAAMCASTSTCTAYSYLPDDTCNLHEGDMNPNTCSQPATSAEHFKKVPYNPCKNGGIFNSTDDTCTCSGGYLGSLCERLMVDCSEARGSGYSAMKGIYKALPTSASAPIQLQCDGIVHHVILERWTGNVTFNDTMAKYVAGFGVTGYDYWVGLQNLHLVTSNSFNYILGIQLSNMSSNPVFYQRYYTNFKVKGAADGYSMSFGTTYTVSDPARPMGNCLSPLEGLSFSTYDVDNDKNASRNCAAEYGGGWWYGPDCSLCNLVGELRTDAVTRIPGSVSEVFWPDMDPPDFSPYAMKVFLYR